MNNSRRQFLKKSITTAAALPILGAGSTLYSNELNHKNWEQISDEQLLKDFEIWVDAYVLEIKKEKGSGKEFKNNVALVNLPAQMEEMMPIFKQRFDRPDFLKSYLRISQKLTQEIDQRF